MWLSLAAGCATGSTTDSVGTFRPDVPLDEWPAEWSELEDEVLRLVNLERFVGGSCGGQGMPGSGPLEMDEVLRGVARTYSAQMADQGFFDHIDPQGRGPDDRVADAGFTGDFPIGENIAEGQRTAEEVVEGWMASPGHCANILEGSFHVIGIGYYFAEDDPFGHYWTQNFAGSH
jgi:uncharacterized protein YkwD